MFCGRIIKTKNEMWWLWFIGGIICGWLLPQARACYLVTNHFLKCMDKRDAKIKEQQRLIRGLKLLLLSKRANAVRPNGGENKDK
jgi:hypothetical protein